MGLLGSLQKAHAGDFSQSGDKRPRYRSFAIAIDTVNARKKSESRSGVWPVHVTEAIDFCGRRHYLIGQMAHKPSQAVGTAKRIMWAIGKAVEHEHRDALIEAYGPEWCFGKWECACGQLVMYGMGRDPYHRKCNACQTVVTTVYKEAVLTYDDLLTGNPDFMVTEGDDPRLMVIEKKSMNTKDFDKLVGALMPHKLQAYFYVRLAEFNMGRFVEAGVLPNLEEFSVMYTNKAFKFTDGVMKEYRVKVSSLPPSVVSFFDEVIAQLRQLKDSGTLPTERVCDSPTCARAKSCPVRGECFGA